MNDAQDRTTGVREWWIRYKARRLVRQVEARQWFLAMVMDSMAREDGFESYAAMQEAELKRFSSEA